MIFEADHTQDLATRVSDELNTDRADNLMQSLIKRLGETPTAGIFSLLLVWCGLAIGHALVVTQHAASPMGMLDTVFSFIFGFSGFVLVWIGMKRPENQATLLGWLGGNLIWCGWFEWTWRYTAHFMKIEGINDTMTIPAADGTSQTMEFMILSPELLMIQATTLIVVALLIFFGANKDTRCRMFMWFHRNLKIRPDKMTPGYKRQHARTAAIETVFLIWTIYLFAIFINDPRGISWDSTAAVVITLGFVVWAIYLINKLLKIRGLGAAFRYAIPTGNIAWLPIESFSRWGLYPEVWIKPSEFPVQMGLIVLIYIIGIVLMYRTDLGKTKDAAEPATA